MNDRPQLSWGVRWRLAREGRDAVNYDEIQLTAPLPPDTVMHRLEAFGRDWRESKMPPELRHTLAFGASVRVSGRDFVLRPTSGQWLGGLCLLGQVAPASEGSVIRGRVAIATSKAYWASWGLLGALVLYWVIAAAVEHDFRGIVEGLGVAVFSGVAYSLMVAMQVGKATPQFKLVLARALEWPGAAT